MLRKQTSLFLAAALLIPFTAAAASNSTEKCADILIITCRGTTEPQNKDGVTPNILSNGGLLVTSNGNATSPEQSLTLEHMDPDTGEGKIGYVAIGFQDSISGSGVTIAREAVVYPASNESPGDFNASFTKGYDNLVGIVKGAVASCKDQKIVLLGYSQGAMVVGDVLGGPGGTIISGPVKKPDLAPEKYADSILAVVLWADIRHNFTGQESFTRGFPVGKEDGYFPRTEEQDSIILKYYGKKTTSFCNAQDTFCSSGAFGKDENKTVVEAVGYNETKGEFIHERSYLMTSVNASVDFIREQAQSAGFKVGSGNRTVTGTANGTASSTTATGTTSGTGTSDAGRIEVLSTVGMGLVLTMLGVAFL